MSDGPIKPVDLLYRPSGGRGGGVVRLELGAESVYAFDTGLFGSTSLEHRLADAAIALHDQRAEFTVVFFDEPHGAVWLLTRATDGDDLYDLEIHSLLKTGEFDRDAYDGAIPSTDVRIHGRELLVAIECQLRKCARLAEDPAWRARHTFDATAWTRLDQHLRLR